MAVKREHRFASGIQIRDAGDAKDGRIGTITGYAAVFNSWSLDLGGFREKISPGAFANSLSRGDDVRAFGHHRPDQIIGRRSAGTLTLKEDDKGLYTEIAIPDTTAGRDVLVSVKRNDLTGMSFQFDTIADEWSKQTENGVVVYQRDLKQVDIYEVSVVVFPAYTDTSLEARDLLSQVAKEGKRRVGTDAGTRRDLVIRMHNRRVALWT